MLLLQILPDGDLKPQSKHLQTRADYLLKVMNKYMGGGAMPAGGKVKVRNNNILMRK